MVYFFADDHFGTNAGAKMYESLPEELKREIYFDDVGELLESGAWEPDCELLILHLIGGTCGRKHPGPGAERAVRNYCGRGGNLLLLHGSSAAFWQWNWWRRIAGLRRVRPEDPDGAPPSRHPKAPYMVIPDGGALASFHPA